MSLIKDKPLRKKVKDTRVTIDIIHNNILDNYNKDIARLEKQLKLNKNNKKINDDIGEIKDKINNYYLENGLLLNEYYSTNSFNNKSENNNKTNILDYFNTTKEQKQDKLDDATMNKDIIKKYLSKIDNNILDNSYDIENNIYICQNCNSDKLYYKQYISEIFCEDCGYCDKIMASYDNYYYKDTPKETTYFSYKRINHFNEWLAQFQGKETTDIPSKVYEDVLKELNKNIHFDKKKLSIKEVRQILKKLKYNKYYEHIPNILNSIIGKDVPILTRECEELLRIMFKEIQEPFIKHCPENRKNFLSYSYVLHKFSQLLELDHLLEYFTLLKSREKLQQQDSIWKLICEELSWEFIPSI